MIARFRGHLAADQGFTLPELLITTVIMGVIVGAIGAALITALRLYAQPSQKLGPSNDANLIANYFTADVNSATANDQSPNGSAIPPEDPTGCTYTTPVTATNLVRLSWTDNEPTPTVQRLVTYQFDSTAKVLTRVTCTKGGAASAATIGRNILSASVTVSPDAGSYEFNLTARDPEAPTTDAPFTFSFRSYQRNAGSDNSGGGSGSGPAKLPTGAAIGTITAFSDLGGTASLGPLTGVGVTLSNATFTATRTSGTNGKFYIGTVPPGVYTLSINPAGYIATTNSPTPLSSSVTIGTVELARNFSIVKVGSIAGLVRTGPVTPVPGATVALSGPVNSTVVTGAGGTYGFPNLPTGSYSVTVTPPAGYTIGAAPHCGPTAITGNAFVCPDVVLTQATYTIGGIARTAASAPIANATVSISGGYPNTTTNAAGQFTFTVADGSYTVTVQPPPGYVPTSGVPCNVTMNLANQTCPDAVFTPPAGATITGTVKRDFDLNGTGDVGIANVTITLSPGTTTTTDTNGNFTFSAVPDGTYNITQTAPPGYTQVPAGSITVTVAGGVTTPPTISFVDTRQCSLLPSQPMNTIDTAGNGNNQAPVAGQTLSATVDGVCSGPVSFVIPARPNNSSAGPSTAVTLSGSLSGAYSYISAQISGGGSWRDSPNQISVTVLVGGLPIGTIPVTVTP